MTMSAIAERMRATSMNWTLRDVIAATGGDAIPGAPDLLFSSVTTDSRHVEPGALFFALRGPRHDGHDFVPEAVRLGVAGAVVDHPIEHVSTGQVCVPDTLKALGDLARWTRLRAPVQVVAVTGSNGKTTTKEMIAAICAAANPPATRTRILKTEGNENNLIGLPRTVLRLRGDEAVAVLEMGMNRSGEIARLTEIAWPDYAVITNIGPAHLEGFGGSIAGVAAAKAELFAGLTRDAVMAVNADDDWVRRMAAPFQSRKVTFGTDGEVRARAVADLGTDGLAFDLSIAGRASRVRLHFVGYHNVTNALAAAAIGHAMGVSLEVIARGLESAFVTPMRMQIARLPNGVTVINDAYNANPSSVEAALRALRRFSGRPVVVLGEMRELGDEARRAHRFVGERAAALGVQQLFLLGAQADAVADGARAGGMHADAIHVCGSHAEVAEAVVARWQPGDIVLVKGSRGMKMEEVVRLLESARSMP
ncbi:MAG: UDP-N-acetylmuramoyl-tripeptide--D-alanyl-D-alanine ligase [Candidatus Binatia bacterium]